MNLQHKYMLVCAIAFILLPIISSTMTGKATSTDWTYRHSIWIKEMSIGNFSSVSLYPPLFELIMLPFSIGSFPILWFQVIFAALSIIGIIYFLYREESENTLIIVVIMLAASIAYVEFSSALMPQSLDYFLFPLAAVFYFKKRVKSMAALLAVDFFMHGIGYIFIGILFAHSLLQKDFKTAKILFIMLTLLAPLFVYYNFLAPTGLFWDWQAQAAWERQYLDPFWKFFAFSGFLTWLLLPFALRNLRREKFKLSETQRLYIIWIAAFIPLALLGYGYWRAISYQIVPLSFLVASLVSDK